MHRQPDRFAYPRPEEPYGSLRQSHSTRWVFCVLRIQSCWSPAIVMIRTVLFQCAGNRTIGETVAAASAFSLDHFIHMMDILHLRMDGELGTGFAADTAGDAKALLDPNLHCNPTLFFSTQSAAGLRGPGLKQKIKNFFDGLLIFGREC